MNENYESESYTILNSNALLLKHDDSFGLPDNNNEEDKNDSNNINNKVQNNYQNNDYNKNNDQGNNINNNLNNLNNNYGYEVYNYNNNDNINNYDDNIIKVNTKPDDKTFKRLKDLQILYKKESALKELFIQTSDKIKTNINDYSKDIYKKKLDVLNILQNKISGQESRKKSILCEDKSILGNLNNYVPKFMTYLWENPKLVANILMNSEIQDVKEHLAPFISNNFYENILSPNYIQDYLMYVMCILLKDEVNKIQTHNDYSKFLCNTTCGFILSHLCQKSDVQEFFKIILEEVVEQIEITCSSKKMTFKLNEIEEQILEKYREKKNKNKSTKKRKDKDKEKDKKRNSPNINMSNYDTINSLNISMSFLSLESEEIAFKYKNVPQTEKEEDFNKIYSIPMDKILLEKLIYQYQDEDKKIYEYLLLQYNKMEEDINIYSNKNFKQKAYEVKDLSYEILQSYQHDFIRIITFIEEILNKLVKNFHFLPYSVKCLCKIISILIRKKFPNITTVEENAFISQFFFYNLFVPIFNNPSTGALINNFIISGNTTHNLNIISYIILQLVSGNFFKNNLKNGDFTFFNRFFIKEMPKLFMLFEELTKVELPPFIEKFVNDELPKDYKYDYFKENPDQLMFHRAICYNLYDLSLLLDNIENNKKKIFLDDSTKLFEKPLRN